MMTRIKDRREFMKKAGQGAFASLAGAQILRLASPASASAQQRKPNIILILADDLAYSDIECYGQKVIRTPNIDRLAKEGLLFTDFYSAAPICAPARCSLMTGLHTGHGLVRGNGSRLFPGGRVAMRPQDVTVAEVLKKAGYVTSLVGKWGLGEPDSTGTPNKKGFDEFFGYLNQNHAQHSFPDYLWKNEQKYPLQKGEYSNDLFIREALDFVRRQSKVPFFLYFASTIPHANPELFKVTGNGMEVPSDEPYSKETWPQLEKNFAATITRLDGDIGKLMGLLKELGLDQNTLVLFTSDNGPHNAGGHDPKFFKSAGPLRGIKGELYEGGIRVPMIARWPGRIRENAVSPEPWTLYDFLPTVAELAGTRVPGTIDGISMAPVLLGRTQPHHEYLYWESFEKGFTQAVRKGNWKAIRTSLTSPLELYDLASDIGEQNNVAARHPEIIAEIEKYLSTARTESEYWPTQQAKAGTNRKEVPPQD
jgi:arylsulfatase A-like enzyme